MLPANKAVIFDNLNDLGLCRIKCYTLLHRTEVLPVNCGLSVAKYQHWLSAMKNNNISIALAQKRLIDRALHKIPSNVISGLAQLTILNRLWY